MSWENDRRVLEVQAEKYERHIVLHNKDNLLCKIMSWFLFLITVGRQKRDVWMKTVAVTVANHHFYPKEWSTDSVRRKLVHEAAHTIQMNACGLFLHPIAGMPVFLFLYFLFPIPIGFAYGRFALELHAKQAEWEAEVEQALAASEKPDFMSIKIDALRFANNISSHKYFWAVTKSFATDQAIKKVNEVHATYME